MKDNNNNSFLLLLKEQVDYNSHLLYFLQMQDQMLTAKHLDNNNKMLLLADLITMKSTAIYQEINFQCMPIPPIRVWILLCHLQSNKTDQESLRLLLILIVHCIRLLLKKYQLFLISLVKIQAFSVRLIPRKKMNILHPWIIWLIYWIMANWKEIRSSCCLLSPKSLTTEIKRKPLQRM